MGADGEIEIVYNKRVKGLECKVVTRLLLLDLITTVQLVAVQNPPRHGRGRLFDGENASRSAWIFITDFVAPFEE